MLFKEDKMKEGGAPRILISRSEDLPLWDDLAERLEYWGYRVELNYLNDWLKADPETYDVKRPLLGVDMVILTAKLQDFQLAAEAKQELAETYLYTAGRLQGHLGAENLVFLTEEGVGPLADDENIKEVFFKQNMVAPAAEKLLGIAEATLSHTIPIRYRQKSFREQLREMEFLIPAVLLTLPILFLTAIALLAVLAGNGAQVESASVSSSSTSLPEPKAPIVTAPSSTVFQFVTSQPTPQVSFPAVCSFKTSKNQLLPTRQNCSSGSIALEGFTGPWHNLVEALWVDPGVELVVIYESGRQDRFVGDPLVTTPPLVNLPEAAFGIEELVFSFTAPGQRAFLKSTSDQQVKFTFS